jgi:cytochrome c oxidase subunit 2
MAALTVCSLMLCSGVGYVVAAQTDSVPVQQVHLIKVSAKRFVFTPAELKLKKDETVDIEITVDDVPMGFSVPDMNTRTDLFPGKVATVRLTPKKTGSFPFLCDVFCGSGHEDMNGMITVTD